MVLLNQTAQPVGSVYLHKGNTSCLYAISKVDSLPYNRHRVRGSRISSF